MFEGMQVGGDCMQMDPMIDCPHAAPVTTVFSGGHSELVQRHRERGPAALRCLERAEYDWLVGSGTPKANCRHPV